MSRTKKLLVTFAAAAGFAAGAVPAVAAAVSAPVAHQAVAVGGIYGD